MEKILQLPAPIIAYLAVTAVMGIVTFIVFGIDKLMSKTKVDLGIIRITPIRIPEKTLINLSLLGGSVGGILGMLIFRHKIRKDKFRFGVPAALLLWIALGMLLLYMFTDVFKDGFI